MTSSPGFSMKPKILESASFEDEDLFVNEEEDEDFDSQEYIEEVPYTSSSVDRSSIGSIPWADDAIKINKNEWEKVEKLLSGLEPLANVEEDLRKEILDWQKKFPHLLDENQHKTKNLSSDSLDFETLPSLDIPSEEEDETANDKTTLTREHQNFSLTPTPANKRMFKQDDTNLCELMDNFTLESVPLKLNDRGANRKLVNNRKRASSSSSYSLRTPPTPIQQVPKVIATANRLHMPPIFNVLDSTRKFRNLAQKKHLSFVQLTQIQQAKSAAVAQEQKSKSRYRDGHRSAWNVPLAANRFFNNRNSIILPSISSRHLAVQPIISSTNSDMATSQQTTPSSGSLRTNNLLRRNIHSFSYTNTNIKRSFLPNKFETSTSTQTNSTSNTTASGRSISAAVQYPRTSLNALYLPYSASKFHVYK